MTDTTKYKLQPEIVLEMKSNNRKLKNKSKNKKNKTESKKTYGLISKLYHPLFTYFCLDLRNTFSKFVPLKLLKRSPSILYI